MPPDTWDAMVNGQQVGGTHPTGMLSFLYYVSTLQLIPVLVQGLG